jgi:hypothetical protein
MDAETWVGLDAKLRKAYNKPQDREQSELYFGALKLMPGPTIRLAIEQLIKQEKYFPNVATIHEYCDNASRAVAAPASMCDVCHGDTWIDEAPIHAFNTIYRNVVDYCPQCHPRPEKRWGAA